VIAIKVADLKQEYNENERLKNNSEYLMKLDESRREHKEGKTITFEIEELEAMETMTHEETQELIEKARLRGNPYESNL